MCGIGLYAVLTNSTDNCAHCDTQHDIIRTCIANAIEPRGPDVPHSHLHRPSNTESAWDVYMCASVLHMRGPAPTVQPYCLTHNDHHFAFLWNGECYSMTPDPSSSSDAFYDTASVHEPCHSHSSMQLPLQDGLQVHSSSDTQLVLQSLLQSAFSIDASHTTQDTLVKLAQAMSSIQGEYAFALWVQPISEIKEDQGSIYFARDPLGRRSLLMHTDPVSASTSVSSMDTIDAISSLILSSVALTDFFIHGQEAVSIQGDSAKTIVHPLQEVIPGRVYHLDLSKKRLSFVTIPSISISIPFSSPPLSSSVLDSKIQPSHPATSSGSSSFLDPSHDISSSPTLQAAEHLLTLLHAAVRRRVVDLSSYPNPSTTYTAKVALLFSGGLDSVVLAALSHFHIPLDQYIDLINVSFASSSTSTTTLTPSTTDGEHPLKPCLDMKNKTPASHVRNDIEEEEDDQNIYNKTDPFASPDRIAAIQSFHELCQLWPQRKWRLILVNILYSEVLDYQTRIRTLIHPLTSTMDFNIGTAMWFASRGKGIEYTETSYHSSYPRPTCCVTSDARIVLVGIGADEQMAGYGRHRSVYNRGGYDALRNELKMEKARLWTRNLGRDDRIISDQGKEARFPYLDENVVQFLNTLDATEVCDMTKAPGEGDKLILRLIAQKMGLKQCSGLVKRAIQFGSRIAKVSDVHRFGSSHKAQGWKTFQ